MTLSSPHPGRDCFSVSTNNHRFDLHISYCANDIQARMPLVFLHRLQREPQEHHKQQRQEKTTQLQGAVSCTEDDRRPLLGLHQTLPHVSRRAPRTLARVAVMFSRVLTTNRLRTQLGPRQANDARRGFTTRMDPGGKLQQSATESQTGGEDRRFAQQRQQQRAEFPQTDEQETW